MPPKLDPSSASAESSKDDTKFPVSSNNPTVLGLLTTKPELSPESLKPFKSDKPLSHPELQALVQKILLVAGCRAEAATATALGYPLETLLGVGIVPVPESMKQSILSGWDQTQELIGNKSQRYELAVKQFAETAFNPDKPTSTASGKVVIDKYQNNLNKLFEQSQVDSDEQILDTTGPMNYVGIQSKKHLDASFLAITYAINEYFPNDQTMQIALGMTSEMSVKDAHKYYSKGEDYCGVHNMVRIFMSVHGELTKAASGQGAKDARSKLEKVVVNVGQADAGIKVIQDMTYAASQYVNAGGTISDAEKVDYFCDALEKVAANNQEILPLLQNIRQAKVDDSGQGNLLPLIQAMIRTSAAWTMIAERVARRVVKEKAAIRKSGNKDRNLGGDINKSMAAITSSGGGQASGGKGGKGRDVGKDSSKNRKCYICNLKGHYANKCPFKQRKPNPSGGGDSNSAGSSGSQNNKPPSKKAKKVPANLATEEEDSDNDDTTIEGEIESEDTGNDDTTIGEIEGIDTDNENLPAFVASPVALHPSSLSVDDGESLQSVNETTSPQKSSTTLPEPTMCCTEQQVRWTAIKEVTQLLDEEGETDKEKRDDFTQSYVKSVMENYWWEQEQRTSCVRQRRIIDWSAEVDDDDDTPLPQPYTT